jgi:AcrR family transcriptional regulator
MARTLSFNREEKLKLAMEVFWKKGFSNTSVHDLVDALQINRFSLYNSFGDKKMLYFESLIYYVDKITLPNFEILRSNTASWPEIELYLNQFVERQYVDNFGCFVQNALIENATDNEQILIKCKQLLDSIEDIIEPVVKRAQEENYITNEVDSKMIAKTILVQMQGIRVMNKSNRHHDIAASLDAFITLMKLPR